MSVTVPKSPREWHSRVWSLSWPMILANVTLPLVGVVDTAVMGRQPDATYVGAVALGSTIFNAIYWMYGFLRMSSTGLTAQALGAGRTDELAAIAIRAFSAAAALGVMLLALQWPIGSFMFWLFEASEAVESQAAGYFVIRVWGMPAVLIYIVAIGVLFGLQRMAAALFVSLVFNGTNIALDLWFVLGLGWGVDGVAAGTVISEWLAAALSIAITFRALRQSGWRGRRPPELWNRGRLGDLTNVSTNLIVRTFFVQLPFFMLTALSAYLGDLVLAANAVLMQFFHIMAYALDGFAHTTETLTGHAFGANDPRRLRRAGAYCAFWAGVLGRFTGPRLPVLGHGHHRHAHPAAGSPHRGGGVSALDRGGAPRRRLGVHARRRFHRHHAHPGTAQQHVRGGARLSADRLGIAGAAAESRHLALHDGFHGHARGSARGALSPHRAARGSACQGNVDDGDPSISGIVAEKRSQAHWQVAPNDRLRQICRCAVEYSSMRADSPNALRTAPTGGVMGRVHGIETGYLNVVRVTLAIAVVLGVVAVGGAMLWYAVVHLATTGTHTPSDYFESPTWESIRHRVLPTFPEQRASGERPAGRDEETGQSLPPVDERITRSCRQPERPVQPQRRR